MSPQAANEIKAVVEKMKENLQKAEQILDTWSVQPLLKRSGKAQPVDDFEQLQKVTLKERYDVIKKGGALAASRLAVPSTRVHLTMTWVVSFSSLRPFAPRRSCSIWKGMRSERRGRCGARRGSGAVPAPRLMLKGTRSRIYGVVMKKH